MPPASTKALPEWAKAQGWRDTDGLTQAVFALRKAPAIDWARWMDPLFELVRTDALGLSTVAASVLVERAGSAPQTPLGTRIPEMLASSSTRERALGVRLLGTPAARADLPGHLALASALVDRILAKPVGHGFRQDHSPRGVLDALAVLGAWGDLRPVEAQAIAGFYGRLFASPGFRDPKLTPKDREIAGLVGAPARTAVDAALAHAIARARALGATPDAVAPLEQVHDTLGPRSTLLRLGHVTHALESAGRLEAALAESLRALNFAADHPADVDRALVFQAFTRHVDLQMRAGNVAGARDSAIAVFEAWEGDPDPGLVFPHAAHALLTVIQAAVHLGQSKLRASAVQQMLALLHRPDSAPGGQANASWGVRLGDALGPVDPVGARRVWADALGRHEHAMDGIRTPQLDALRQRLGAPLPS